jgi:polygalacturonase
MLSVSNKSINPARSHITLTSCKKGIISNIRLIAPGDSPNTDGIDISSSRDIQVLNSFIGTGTYIINLLNFNLNHFSIIYII